MSLSSWTPPERPVAQPEDTPEPWQAEVVRRLTERSPYRIGESEVWAVQSGSDEHGVHYVIVIPGGRVICTCKGYRYKGKCRHRIEVGAEMA